MSGQIGESVPSVSGSSFGEVQYAVVALRPPSLERMMAIAQLLQSTLCSLGFGIRLMYDNSDIGVLWPLSRRGYDHREHAQYVANLLTANGLDDVLPVATTSGPVSAGDAATAFQQARAALDARLLYDKSDRVIQHDPSRFFDVLMLLDRDWLLEYCRRRLEKIEEYDREHEGHLMETLETYFDQDCSISKTARALFVHPNTVKYRLSQVTSLLNSERLEFPNLVETFVALKVRRTVQARRGP